MSNNKFFHSDMYDLIYNIKLSIIDFLIQFDKKYLNYRFDSFLVKKSMKLSQNVLREDIKPYHKKGNNINGQW